MTIRRRATVLREQFGLLGFGYARNESRAGVRMSYEHLPVQPLARWCALRPFDYSYPAELAFLWEGDIHPEAVS